VLCRAAAGGQRGEQDGDASRGEQPRIPVVTRAAKGTMWLQQVPAIFLMIPRTPKTSGVFVGQMNFMSGFQVNGPSPEVIF
jgi:hypothetical protein